ncbi:MAG: vWA domain-containing protein [Gaiellaceae bacterium]
MLRRRRLSIDSPDVDALRRGAIRALLLRVLLVAIAVALLAAAAVSARGLDSRAPGLLPSRSTGVVVLDLSLSIIEQDYPRVGRVVNRLIEADAPVGLVIFSDIPYEALPPGTPARELRPLLHLLTPTPGNAPANPWTDTFRSGTLISAAIELAADMLEREHVENGSILLVSDLETAPDDIPNLIRVIEEVLSRGIELRAVPLSPISESRELFKSLIGADALSAPPEPAAAERRPPGARLGAGVPVGVLVLGALLFVALAGHERFAARLALGRPA